MASTAIARLYLSTKDNRSAMVVSMPTQDAIYIKPQRNGIKPSDEHLNRELRLYY
jgi:hypothetical protein